MTCTHMALQPLTLPNVCAGRRKVCNLPCQHGRTPTTTWGRGVHLTPRHSVCRNAFGAGDAGATSELSLHDTLARRAPPSSCWWFDAVHAHLGRRCVWMALRSERSSRSGVVVQLKCVLSVHTVKFRSSRGFDLRCHLSHSPKALSPNLQSVKSRKTKKERGR